MLQFRNLIVFLFFLHFSSQTFFFPQIKIKYVPDYSDLLTNNKPVNFTSKQYSSSDSPLGPSFLKSQDKYFMLFVIPPTLSPSLFPNLNG